MQLIRVTFKNIIVADDFISITRILSENRREEKKKASLWVI